MEPGNKPPQPYEIGTFNARLDALRQIYDNPAGLPPDKLYINGISLELLQSLILEGLVEEKRWESDFTREDGSREEYVNYILTDRGRREVEANTGF